jgi:hypothetical protein
VYDSRTCAVKWCEEWRRPERRRWAWRCAAARGVEAAAAASRSFRSGGMYRTGRHPESAADAGYRLFTLANANGNFGRSRAVWSSKFATGLKLTISLAETYI